jgi:hypothetical protein
MHTTAENNILKQVPIHIFFHLQQETQFYPVVNTI